MNIDLIILAAGDLGREIYYTTQMINEMFEGNTYNTIAFVDSTPEKIGKDIDGIPIISVEKISEFRTAHTKFICAVGTPSIRIRILNELNSKIESPSFATIIHPSVVQFPNIEVSEGVFIGANTTIATGCNIKQHVVINQNVSIGHDCELNEYAVISPGCILSGRSKIGFASFLGSNVVTYPRVTIGEKCIISAMTVVSRPVKRLKKVISKPNLMVFDIDNSN